MAYPVIAPRQSNSAHLHRPSRETWAIRYKTANVRFRTTAVGTKRQPRADRPRRLARHVRVGGLSPPTFSVSLQKRNCLGLTPAPVGDSCRNVRPVFLEPGHYLRSIDGSLEGFSGGILEGLGLQTLRCILSEVMQTFVSSSASAIAVLALPRWAKSIMLGASASLNQSVASDSGRYRRYGKSRGSSGPSICRCGPC
jgi:hypothetical protein